MALLSDGPLPDSLAVSRGLEHLAWTYDQVVPQGGFWRRLLHRAKPPAMVAITGTELRDDAGVAIVRWPYRSPVYLCPHDSFKLTGLRLPLKVKP